MGYSIIHQIGSSYNAPVRTIYLSAETAQDYATGVANLPLNVPAGSICEAQVKPQAGETKSTLHVLMLYKTEDLPNNGTWYEI